MKACPACGSATRIERPGKGPHAAAECCDDDGRWLPAPATPEWAAAFRLPHGSYRGKRLGWLATVDPAYLRWAADHFPDRRIADLCRIALENRPAPAGGGARD